MVKINTKLNYILYFFFLAFYFIKKTILIILFHKMKLLIIFIFYLYFYHLITQNLAPTTPLLNPWMIPCFLVPVDPSESTIITCPVLLFLIYRKWQPQRSRSWKIRRGNGSYSSNSYVKTPSNSRAGEWVQIYIFNF